MRFTCFLLAAILAGSGIGSGAQAQNQQFVQQPTIVGSVSVNEIIIFLNAAEFSAQLLQEFDDGGSPAKIVEATSDGLTIYFGLRECNGAGVTARCQLVEPFAYFNGSGVTLSQLNTFNLSQSKPSFAGLLPEGNGIISSKIWLTQGVTPGNFGFQVGIFLLDIDLVLGAITPGTLASVNYTDDNDTTSRGLIARQPYRERQNVDWQVNAVGPKAPDFMNDAVRGLVNHVYPD